MITKKNYKEIFKELVKERIYKIKELIHEINHNDLIYYLTGDTARKGFYDFNDGVEFFRKMQYGECNMLKLEDAKKLRNLFKSNLNEISKWGHKSKEQRSALENIKLL